MFGDRFLLYYDKTFIFPSMFPFHCYVAPLFSDSLSHTCLFWYLDILLYHICHFCQIVVFTPITTTTTSPKHPSPFTFYPSSFILQSYRRSHGFTMKKPFMYFNNFVTIQATNWRMPHAGCGPVTICLIKIPGNSQSHLLTISVI